MENEKKPRKDKRSQRTRALISDTLQELLQKKLFSDITVNDICIEAEVSRATFYLYFEDKYKLLGFTVERWGEEVRSVADVDDLRSLVRGILEVLYAHRHVIRNVEMADHNHEVANMLHTNLVGVLERAFEKELAAGARLLVPIKTVAVYCAAGFTYTILWWLGGGIEASLDEMCSHLVAIAEDRAIVRSSGKTPSPD